MNKIIITGAAGFLGGRTAKFFAKNMAESNIIATSRRDFRKTELEISGSTFIAGDLKNAIFCDSLTQNATIIIHCAALSSPWGNYEDFYQSNVVATKNLLQAAIKNKVSKFILISTPSIYFNFEARLNVNEDEELPKKMVNHYAETKLMAEKIVLDANKKGILCIAIRPRAIIGAEDTVIFPRILEAHKQGKLKIIGNGENVVDLTCVRNVIEAIICCINAPESAYGQAYNITNDEPIKLWFALNTVLKGLNLKEPIQKIPKNLALIVAGFIEWKNNILSPNKEPAITKYGIGILADNFTLDISKAKKQLNYKPIQKTIDGINEFVNWYKNS